MDPYRLLAKEDPEGNSILSVLCQAAVPAQYSGAAIVDANGALLVEGRSGEGARFMLGLEAPEELPAEVIDSVRTVHSQLFNQLGANSFEWVHDGERTWVVQLHRGGTHTTARVLIPGDAVEWARFNISAGLERLREFLSELGPDTGVIVVGDVGVTSHVADVLRKARRPSRLERLSE
jgi:hypothetical protein